MKSRTRRGAAVALSIVAASAGATVQAPTASASQEVQASLIGADGCVARNGDVRGKVYLHSTCGASRTVRAEWNCAGQYTLGGKSTISPGQSKILYGPSSYCWFSALYQG
jgi:hypothetical protein